MQATNLPRHARCMVLLCVLAGLTHWNCPAQPASAADAVAALVQADWLDQDRRYSEDDGTTSVTTSQDAAGGCDGIKNGKWGFHTASGEQDPWWQVDLETPLLLDRVVIYNRTDSGTAPRTKQLRVLASLDGSDFVCVFEHSGEPFYGVEKGEPLVVSLRGKDVQAQYVRLHVAGKCSFALDEVEVYAADSPEVNVALGKPADQKSVGPYSFPGTLGETTHAETGCHLAHSRAILEQAQALMMRLAPDANSQRLQPLAARLAELGALVAKLESDAGVPERVREAVYLEARELKRAIAFANPLVDFDNLLFIKRHDSKGVFHMCDQYYGFNSVPGGGLFVLSDPFGLNPTLMNLLEHSVVERGRLEGQRLNTGAFLSPELSFDGKTILFAYSEAKGDDLEWTPESSYHLFKVNADGTGLVQLTDGPWNDFDPCFLPGGRVAFITERRGGYLRCGRHCPVYTMYSMNDDGSDILCLSFHETHEWHPSVSNDGMIVYTRWDYVDRDTNVAHHIWTSYPDGRDPRSFHGNYPMARESRPWMEMSIRAIPDSPRFVATAGAHHGHAFGSLVLIDPRAEDDGAMSQLTRLTPDVPFPEAERNIKPISECMVYGTPWPLSEDDYLCVYGADAKNRGLYWIDRFGNKELLYRDPAISCLSPIPLRPRRKPPVIPSRTTRVAQRSSGETQHEATPATIAVMDVYNSDFEWPENTRVVALRIIQALPKTTAPPNDPRIGIANQTNARAVLGTVPVERDGSAHFEAPVGKLIYFQALDERGLAIQSMRSGTYVHPGEQLTCLGCHEKKHGASSRPTGIPLALQRPPSKVQPDVDGSNPFNYVRLVQPVLDRHCAECHQKEGALDLAGVTEDKFGWTRSYTNLAEKYGFYFHVSNGSINTGVHGGSRTIPGKFGAHASALLDYLDEKHYGVNLPEEDFHRIVLWLDCNSEFYGAYENIQAQAKGEVVWPSLN